MFRIEFAPEVSDDFERIPEHLERYDVTDAPARIEEIIQGPKPRSWNAYFLHADRLSEDFPDEIEDAPPQRREAL